MPEGFHPHGADRASLHPHPHGQRRRPPVIIGGTGFHGGYHPAISAIVPRRKRPKPPVRRVSCDQEIGAHLIVTLTGLTVCGGCPGCPPGGSSISANAVTSITGINGSWDLEWNEDGGYWEKINIGFWTITAYHECDCTDFWSDALQYASIFAQCGKNGDDPFSGPTVFEVWIYSRYDFDGGAPTEPGGNVVFHSYFRKEVGEPMDNTTFPICVDGGYGLGTAVVTLP